jgi:hypothetical protein
MDDEEKEAQDGPAPLSGELLYEAASGSSRPVTSASVTGAAATIELVSGEKPSLTNSA